MADKQLLHQIAMFTLLGVSLILNIVTLAANSLSKTTFDFSNISSGCTGDYKCGWTKGKLCTDGCSDAPFYLKDECVDNTYSYHKQITINNACLAFSVITILTLSVGAALLIVDSVPFTASDKTGRFKKVVTAIISLSALSAILVFVIFALGSGSEQTCNDTECFYGIGCLSHVFMPLGSYEFDIRLGLSVSPIVSLLNGVLLGGTAILIYLKYPTKKEAALLGEYAKIEDE